MNEKPGPSEQEKETPELAKTKAFLRQYVIAYEIWVKWVREGPIRSKEPPPGAKDPVQIAAVLKRHPRKVIPYLRQYFEFETLRRGERPTKPIDAEKLIHLLLNTNLPKRKISKILGLSEDNQALNNAIAILVAQGHKELKQFLPKSGSRRNPN